MLGVRQDRREKCSSREALGVNFARSEVMHKKIGILGGLSPESTVSYYLYITRTYTERYGDYSYPEIIIYSVSLQRYHDWRNVDRWDLIAADMIEAARGLERAGADFGIIATNTMHLVFDEVQAAVKIPFLHLIDATAKAIQQKGCSVVGLLGTKFTMSHRFYRDRLAANGITSVAPEAEDQEIVHGIIETELVRGVIKDDSKRKYLQIIRKMEKAGVEGVILGCTKIPLLIQEKDYRLPLFDTTSIHAETALHYAIGDH
jgi:aspartate racemase